MSKKYLVIEFSKNLIKIFSMSKDSKSALIHDSFILENPGYLDAESGIYDPQKMGAFLKESLEKKGFKRKDVVISLINANTFTRVHEFPKASSKDLRSMVNMFIKDAFPADMSEYVMDYEILKENKNSCLVRINILKKDLIENYYAILKAAKLNIIAFIPRASGVEKAILHAENINGSLINLKDIFGVLDYNDEILNFSLFQDGTLVYNRDIKIENIEDIEKSIDQVYDTFVQQFRMLLTRDDKYKYPNVLYLSGALVDLIEFKRILSKKFELPVEVISNMDSIKYRRGNNKIVLTDLNGAGSLLALPKKLHRKKYYIDFFNVMKKNSQKKSDTRVLAAGIVIIALILLATSIYTYQVHINNAKRELASLENILDTDYAKSKLTELHQSDKKIKVSSEYYDRLQSTVKEMEGLPRVSGGYFKEIVNAGQNLIVLESIDVQADTIEIAGKSNSINSISTYQNKLEKLSFIKNVYISSVSENNQGDLSYKFQGTCKIDTKEVTENETR